MKLTNLLVITILTCCSFYVYAKEDKPENKHVDIKTIVAADFNAILSPDVLHGFNLGSASVKRGYVTEVTPLDTSGIGAGASVTAFVEPEFNANSSTWIDVVRVKLINTGYPINANIRVYALVQNVHKK